MSKDQNQIPQWQRWLPRFSTVAAGFTTLCCIGLSAATSLASALGATFLLRDSSLRPLLAVVLALTAGASGLTFARHRNPVPLLLIIASAVAIYSFTFLGAHGGGHGDHMDDAMDSHAAHAALSTGRQAAVWLALAVLIGAQVWDFACVRRCNPRRTLLPTEPAARP